MPNHFHGIIEIIRTDSCRYPDCDPCGRDAINRVSTVNGGITKKHNPMLNPLSLSYVIRWFKGRSTFEIKRHASAKSQFTWQPQFHDVIIRNHNDLLRIREYICNNPNNWNIDEFQ